MRGLGLVLFILSLSFTANAKTWLDAIDEYFSDIYQNTSSGELSCKPIYQNLTRDGHLEIRYALGYFDASANNDLDQQTPEAFSRSVDKGAAAAIRHVLKQKCKSKQHQLCGFHEGDKNDGLSILSKKIQQFGQTLSVRVVLTHASASKSYFDNIGEKATEQEFYTDQSEMNFFYGISQGADIAFYLGHSRNGGGPDFEPPVLRDYDGHPDYKGHYEVQRDGERKLLRALSETANKDQILGMFSCYSSSHFRRNLLRTRPALKMILSHVSIAYNEALFASLGYLEGHLRGLCGKDLETFAEQSRATVNGFSTYHLK